MRTMDFSGMPSYVVAKKESDDQELIIYRIEAGAVSTRKQNFEDPEFLHEDEYLVLKQNDKLIHLSKAQLIDLLNIL